MSVVVNPQLVVALVEAGDYKGPIRVGSFRLAALRISGTGVAWRPTNNEFCLRSADVWLAREMRDACIGLPIVRGHPGADVLDQATFRTMVVGTVVAVFVHRGELWCIGRLYIDDDLDGLDTSPCAALPPDQIEKVVLNDGATVILEGTPRLVDHLAIVDGAAGGVWSRGIVGAGTNPYANKELESA